MKSLRLIFIALLLLSSIEVEGQNRSNYQEFVDVRDGKTYETIELGSTIWMAENMKFKTENSEEHYNELSKTNYDGYYYPLGEIDNVCPDGYRIPTTKEWETYIKLILELKNIPEDEIKFSRLTKKGDEYVIGGISGEKLQAFKNPNPLNIKDQGHTQNGEITGLGSFNIWIKHDVSSDPKYHLHLDDDGYLIHTHKHHIVGKKKKRRKFSIRCVSGEFIEN